MSPPDAKPFDNAQPGTVEVWLPSLSAPLGEASCRRRPSAIDGSPAMAGIFISYRRSDSGGYTGRLMDDLKEQFPTSEVFRDVEAIEAGSDFVEAIDKAVGSCSVLLAVIGPRWLSASDAAGRRRIEDENDFVRLEIATALRRDVRVIPVLVEGAPMPSADDLPNEIKLLARRQAHELSDRRWEFDVDQLFTALEKVPGIHRKRTQAAAAPPPQPRAGMGVGTKVVLGALGAVIVVGVLALLGREGDPGSEVALMQPLPPTPSTQSPQPPADPPVSVPARRSAAPAQAPNISSAPPARQAAATAPTQGQADEMAELCGAPAQVSGTWQWAIGNGPPGMLVITQSGTALNVAEFNALGQQIGIGGGVLCGDEAEITITNALWGQFVLNVTLSHGAMSGTVNYQGQQGQVQGMRQG